ncbi:HV03 protein, partial [Todus mexicanus]|nr:HV03 protein [Todus mexicanus]
LWSPLELVESGGGLQPPERSQCLLCKASGFSFGNTWMMWVRQTRGKGLKWIAGMNSNGADTRYAPSVKGRFSISRDNAQSMVTLQMSSLRADNTATYYCAKSAA